MKIINLKLNNYSRMANLSSNTFEFKPRAKTNIILGSNGMGKSSLLKELLPNTEDTKKEYSNDGYKTLTFEHNNRLFTLSYDSNENQYSFIVDDNELNPSYNMKTFKRLIEEEFNLSKDVFNLLIGLTNFTTMSTGERKKWFTEILSDTDYEYGLVIYNKARIRFRELTGMLKMIESKLLKEYEELKNSTVDKDKTIKDIKYLETIKYDLTNLLNKPSSVPNKYEELKSVINEYYKLNNIEIDNEINDKLQTAKNNIQSIKYNIEEHNKQINSLSTMLNKSEKIIELEKELIDLNKTIGNYNLDNKFTIEEWIDIYNFIKENYVEFIDLFNSLDELQTDKSIKDLETLSINLNKLNNDLKQYKEKGNLLTVKLKELEKNKNHKLECPKCKNIWSPNYSDSEYNNYLKELTVIEKEIKTINEEINELDKTIKTLTDKKSVMWKMVTLFKSNTTFYNYLKWKLDDRGIEKYYKELNKEIKDDYYMLKDSVDNIKKIQRKVDIEKQLEFAKNINKDDKDKLQDLLNKTIDNKVILIRELEQANKEYNKLSNIKNKMDSKLELGNKVISLLKTMHKYKINKVKELKYNYNINVIDIINSMINELKDKLTSVEVRENKIKELENDKKDLSNKKKSINKIMTALSPNKGLLAKGLIEFVNRVIEDMNTIISNIFDYDLSIKYVDLDNGKLDFTFKLMSKGNLISDISKGSSGMREVIDLAFKLVAMNILGMEDYPLILDEFGRALDPVHRSNAYDYINEISNEMFSQIFIVTHNEDVFSRFPNAGIILLDKQHYDIKEK